MEKVDIVEHNGKSRNVDVAWKSRHSAAALKKMTFEQQAKSRHSAAAYKK